MAAITKIEFWSDVGFVDGAVEIPRLNAPDPTNPTVTIEEEILPSKDRFFSELKLKEYYTGLLTMSYMRVTYDLKNSLGVDTLNVFYGWVDSVKLSSDGELPMTIISWHIDEWRTWKSAVTFGSGHVKRRPFRDLATTPVQNYQYRYLELGSDDASTKINLMAWSLSKNGHPVWWVYLSCSSSGTPSEILSYAYPFFTYPAAAVCYFKGIDEDTNQPVSIGGPSLISLYEGRIDEYFSIDPDSIIGIWLSPLPPVSPIAAAPTGSGVHNDPYDFGSISLLTKVSNGYGMIDLRKMNAVTQTGFSKTIGPITPDESTRYIVTDPDGHKMLEIPYGMTIDSVENLFYLEPDGPYIEVTFRDGSLGNVEGLTVNYPLMCLPVNSNAWSSYVYSGKREYDKEMRTVQSNANAWKTSAGGAGSGAMMGAFGPAGLAVGAIGGTAGGLVSYGVEMLYQNDEEQRLEDRLVANQANGMITSGGALKGIFRQYGIELHQLKMDDYSSNQVIATRNQFGISVDELMSSCDLLIRSTSPTGYYNIQNMIVNGNVPVSAKKWIREKFRSGVRLI